ncbi:MAG: VCBS repeat-containing protein, partial [Cyclobacteriaceae bacterium]|nr:VCBS repeat-containing protein [Cyclobacteriaceae bacterium]
KSQFDNPTHVRPGMVKDAVWCDLNNDHLPDLILAGEWMPVTILIQQTDHKFMNATALWKLTSTRGWWNTLTAGDFDEDGDQDLIAGNEGLNTRLRATTDKPVGMYLGDFDSNGSSDHIIVYYNGNKSYPFTSRDQLVKQIPSLKKKFLHYTDYRDVKLEDIITPQQQGNSALMEAELMSSVLLRNEGGHFTVHALPDEAQWSPIKSVLADDVDGDGHMDLLLGGNMTATQPDLGPADAGFGLMLQGDGQGNFLPVAAERSGLIVSGEVRSIQRVKTSDGKKIYLISRNNDSLLGFRPAAK